MPPARKSAAAKTDPEAASVPNAPVPQDALASGDVPAAVEPDAVDSEPAAPVEAPPAAPLFHWQAVSGGSANPCRDCFPFGPPVGAGAVGCQHGQWVRVEEPA